MLIPQTWCVKFIYKIFGAPQLFVQTEMWWEIGIVAGGKIFVFDQATFDTRWFKFLSLYTYKDKEKTIGMEGPLKSKLRNSL